MPCFDELAHIDSTCSGRHQREEFGHLERGPMNHAPQHSYFGDHELNDSGHP